MGLKPKIIKPSDFINPLLSKKSVEQEKFEKFQKDLEAYKTNIHSQHVSKQSEPNIVSNALKPFFESFGYTAQSFSQKGQSGVDLVLMREHKPCVIIEAKKHNEADMITKNSLHKKSLYEAILYFMRERDGGNNALFHVVITDFFSWFIFDAKDFDRLFWQNKQIKKIYTNYKDQSILGDKTKDFYENIAKELPNLEVDVESAYFNLQEPQKPKDLIAIYKLLSPDTLLKEFNPNDANSLNREFYSELLYILGLEEVKEGSKKVIQRAKESQSGSFYENIANKLTQYAKPNDFETIIKLIIIWINRILFLKLLESQIVSWNKNREFKFLDADKIDDYDKLEMLFFEILAKRPQSRKHREFDYIPYLNSSLFEIHANEDKYLKISNLEDDAKINYYSKTILKDEKRAKKSGQTSTLAYLFKFLDAYDFGSTSDEIANESKSLINASVLGLIFEKINGYKDGSFYTPSFITMYMARESLQKSIIERFNTAFSIEASNFNELKKYCELQSYKDDFSQKANKIIDSLTICDPAVGSGHFLVSALNEIIYIKYQLGLFNLKGLKIELINDELLVKLEDEWFEYTKPKDFQSPNHMVQKMLFLEKQRIIENQLFGVDINPNSSQITKLRLWIELLKNSYYDANYELITLPNIDINIKTGNSLISRFDLKDEIKINNIKHEIKNYKERVREYKENLGTKKDVLASIEGLKSKFRLTLKAEYKVTKERNQKLREYVTDFGHEGLNDDLLLTAIKNKYGHVQNLFGEKADAKKQAKLLEELTKLETQIDEIEKGKIYEDAFEWRFEFPEVLDEEGNFVGFDIVIGNPPYIDSETMTKSTQKEREYYSINYLTAKGNWDLFIPFIELSHIISKNANIGLIIPNKWLAAPYALESRNNYKGNVRLILDYTNLTVFDEAGVSAIVLFFYDKQEKLILKKYYPNLDVFENTIENLQNVEPLGIITSEYFDFLQRIKRNSVVIEDLYFVHDSATTSDAYQIKNFVKNYSEDSNNYLKLVTTGTIQKYFTTWQINETPYLKNKYFMPIIDTDSYMINFLNKSKVMLNKKLIVTGMRYLRAIYDNTGTYLAGKTTRIILEKNKENSLFFLLGILNSKFMSFYMIESFKSSSMGGGINISPDLLKKLPIPIISSNDQQPLINLANEILHVKKENPKADTSELEATIDELVYKLYNLTDEEIKIIRGEH